MLNQFQPKMTVDEFLDWAEAQANDYELIYGRVYAMSPERLRHVEAKGETYSALRAAIIAAGVPCRAYVDGVTIRIDGATAFRPDVLVRCGNPLDGNMVEIPDPLIVVEVTSPSTRNNDGGVKFSGYFGVPSVQHYLQVDPDKRLVIHHRRDGEEIRSRILGSGSVRLDPPGLDLTVEDLLGPGNGAP